MKYQSNPLRLLCTLTHHKTVSIETDSTDVSNECLFQWVDVGGSESHKKPMEKGKSAMEDKGREERHRLRLQDKELQEMSDGGWCLSMHQPWASLLVKGIKR